MAPRSRQRVPRKDEVERRWSALPVERRQALMSFDDPALVERIKSSLQALFEKQTLMHQLGIRLPSGGDGGDEFASSALFTSAFELSWQIGRSRREPGLVLVDPALMPVMAIKTQFLERPDFLESMSAIVPDLLRPAVLGGSPARTPLPRARWKELFAAEPSSIAGMEQQLVRLVEQALWFIAEDPSYEVGAASPSSNAASQDSARPDISQGALGSDDADFEAWIAEEDELRRREEAASKQKKPKKKKKRGNGSGAASSGFSAGSALPPTVEEEEENEEEDECDRPVQLYSYSASTTTAPPASSEGPRTEDEVEELGDVGEDEEEDDEEDDAESHADESIGTGVFHTSDVGGPSLQLPETLFSASRLPTGASTPVADVPRAAPPRTLRTPPASPAARSYAPHSSQLICYIWNQTSQFDHALDLDGKRPALTMPAPTPETTSSTPKVASTPSGAFGARSSATSSAGVSRGSWTPLGSATAATSAAAALLSGASQAAEGAGGAGAASPSLTVVVKNTFVDIVDPEGFGDREAPGDKAGQRSSRSMSPSLLRHMDNDWRYW